MVYCTIQTDTCSSGPLKTPIPNKKKKLKVLFKHFFLIILYKHFLAADFCNNMQNKSCPPLPQQGPALPTPWHLQQPVPSLTAQLPYHKRMVRVLERNHAQGKQRGLVQEAQAWLWYTSVPIKRCWKTLPGPQQELNPHACCLHYQIALSGPV